MRFIYPVLIPFLALYGISIRYWFDRSVSLAWLGVSCGMMFSALSVLLMVLQPKLA